MHAIRKSLTVTVPRFDNNKIDMQKHLSCFRCKESNPSRMPATSHDHCQFSFPTSMCRLLVLTCSNTARFLAVEAEVSLKNSWVLMLQNETYFKILLNVESLEQSLANIIYTYIYITYKGKRWQTLLEKKWVAPFSMLKPDASRVNRGIQMSGSDKKHHSS